MLDNQVLNISKILNVFRGLFFNKIADIAGVKVTDTNAEKNIENAIVKANCLYNFPVVPGKNATGTNTVIKTREVARTAPKISFIPSTAAS